MLSLLFVFLLWAFQSIHKELLFSGPPGAPVPLSLPRLWERRLLRLPQAVALVSRCTAEQAQLGLPGSEKELWSQNLGTRLEEGPRDTLFFFFFFSFKTKPKCGLTLVFHFQRPRVHLLFNLFLFSFKECFPSTWTNRLLSTV